MQSLIFLIEKFWPREAGGLVGNSQPNSNSGKVTGVLRGDATSLIKNPEKEGFLETFRDV